MADGFSRISDLHQTQNFPMQELPPQQSEEDISVFDDDVSPNTSSETTDNETENTIGDIVTNAILGGVNIVGEAADVVGDAADSITGKVSNGINDIFGKSDDE